MKARLPEGYRGGSGNMQNMLKQAQKMQDDIGALQEELEAREYTASAGGGMVEVRVNGKKQVLGIHIKPEAVDPDDMEMLEDLVAAAVNEAGKVVDDTAEEEMNKVTGGKDFSALGGLM